MQKIFKQYYVTSILIYPTHILDYSLNLGFLIVVQIHYYVLIIGNCSWN